MSLVRLLSAGKSLVGLKESNGRYHLPNQRVLPRFEGRKNPFRSSSSPAPAQPARDEPVAAPQLHPAANTAASTPKQDPGGNASNVKPTEFVRNILTRLSCVLGKRGPAGIKQPAFKAPVGLVQAELSLDSVKVVRNDLSDSDLEVIPVRPSSPEKAEQKSVASLGPQSEIIVTGQPSSARVEPGEKAGKMKVAAAALVGRLFGAG